jgi:hypothetical protein
MDSDRLGDRVDLGGEDRRADGSAVILSAARVCPRRSLSVLAFVLATLAFSLAACTRQPAPPPDAATLLQTIAAADPAKYPSPKESKHWGNPYLVIRPDAVGLLASVAANEEQILKPEEMLNALAQLPASAWPYGRAVAILVDEKPTSSEQDKIALRRNRGIVEGDLQGAHVAIRWIPAS